MSLAIYPALFKKAIAGRDTADFERLLNQYRTNQAFLRSTPDLLVSALTAGFESAVQALHPLAPDLTDALYQAARRQRADLIEAFLVSGRLDTHRALFLLVQHDAGGTALERLLPFRLLDLEVAPPPEKSPRQVFDEECTEALEEAARAGNRDAVLVLARHSDPTGYNSHPLQAAARRAQYAVIEALAPLSDVLAALIILARDGDFSAACRLATYVPEPLLPSLRSHPEWLLLSRVSTLVARLEAREMGKELPAATAVSTAHARL